MPEPSDQTGEIADTTHRARARLVFARVGLMLLGLDMVGLALVVVVLLVGGAGNVPAVLIGGIAGEGFFLVTRARLRNDVLAGRSSPNWLTAGGTELREQLLRKYSSRPVVLLSLPYFVAVAAFGLMTLPWSVVQSWDNLVGVAFLSFIAVLGLANGLQWLYFSRLVGRLEEVGK